MHSKDKKNRKIASHLADYSLSKTKGKCNR